MPSNRVLQAERKLLLKVRKGFHHVASTNNREKLFQRAHRWVFHETVQPSIALDTGGAQDLYVLFKTHTLQIHAKPTVAQQLSPAIHHGNFLHCAHQPPQSSTFVTLTTCGCSLPFSVGVSGSRRVSVGVLVSVSGCECVCVGVCVRVYVGGREVG